MRKHFPYKPPGKKKIILFFTLCHSSILRFIENVAIKAGASDYYWSGLPGKAPSKLRTKSGFLFGDTGKLRPAFEGVPALSCVKTFSSSELLHVRNNAYSPLSVLFPRHLKLEFFAYNPRQFVLGWRNEFNPRNIKSDQNMNENWSFCELFEVATWILPHSACSSNNSQEMVYYRITILQPFSVNIEGPKNNACGLSSNHEHFGISVAKSSVYGIRAWYTVESRIHFNFCLISLVSFSLPWNKCTMCSTYKTSLFYARKPLFAASKSCTFRRKVRVLWLCLLLRFCESKCCWFFGWFFVLNLRQLRRVEIWPFALGVSAFGLSNKLS